jgi:hypothetical protein
MSIKVGTIPLNVSLSVEQVSCTPETVLDVICKVRFAGFDKGSIGDRGVAVRTGKQTVIGKIVLTGDPFRHSEVIAAALATARNHVTNLNFVAHV